MPVQRVKRQLRYVPSRGSFKRCTAAVALLSALALLPGCQPEQEPKQPATMTQICPPDPPPGSGYKCAPPLPCRIDPSLFDVGTALAPFLPAKYERYGAALAHLGLVVQDLCRG